MDVATPLNPSSASSISHPFLCNLIDQKLDHVVAMLKAQRQKTAEIRTEIASVKAEVEDVKKREMSLSSKPTPKSMNLPTDLSVSFLPSSKRLLIRPHFESPAYTTGCSEEPPAKVDRHAV